MAVNSNISTIASAASNRGLVHIRLMGQVTRRGFNKGLVALGAGVLASGAGRAAKAATEINYTGWQGYDDAANAGGFLDKNGLVLQTTYIEANDQIPALAHSGGIGSMDLVTPSAYYVPLNVRGGVLQPLDTSRIPNLKGVMPFFQNIHDLNIDGKTYGVPFAWGSCPLMYNADVIKNVPTSWADLFKDEYKGKVAVTADLTGITIPMASLATGTRTPWLITKSELDATIDLLIKFKREHARTIAPSYGDLANLLGSGEVIMAQGWEPVSAWMGDNAPTVKWVVPKEGCCTFVESYGIAVDAPHEDADYEIVNHVISPEGQAHAAEVNSIAVTVADAVPLLSDAVKNIYPYDDIPGYFARAGGVTPLYPLDSDGTHVTYDEVLKGWERFMAA
jgi:spermidine/putrescine transport system substrate-binding protein